MTSMRSMLIVPEQKYLKGTTQALRNGGTYHFDREGIKLGTTNILKVFKHNAGVKSKTVIQLEDGRTITQTRLEGGPGSVVSHTIKQYKDLPPFESIVFQTRTKGSVSVTGRVINDPKTPSGERFAATVNPLVKKDGEFVREVRYYDTKPLENSDAIKPDKEVQEHLMNDAKTIFYAVG